MRTLKRINLGIATCIALLWVLNTSVFIPVDPSAQPKLLAHRGVHQTYAGQSRSNDTCTAGQVAPITHPFIENTLPSMRQAFTLGAAVVELDVHLTPDGQFAVFHDWTLDCRTDGSGVTEEQTMAYLKTLDVAYGYSSDGQTFPLRGTGIGQMPTLTEVLQADLGGQYLINFKSRRAEEGTALAELLNKDRFRTQIFGFYGGAPPTDAALNALPGLKGYHKDGLMRCYATYALIGWSGYVPAPCRNTVIAVPLDWVPYAWGWPHRFAQRMAKAQTEIILLGPYDGSGFSSGIDTAPMLAQVPEGFAGFIWTNRIEIIGPLVSGER